MPHMPMVGRRPEPVSVASLRPVIVSVISDQPSRQHQPARQARNTVWRTVPGAQSIARIILAQSFTALKFGVAFAGSRA
jgi:hypothetical protein